MDKETSTTLSLTITSKQIRRLKLPVSGRLMLHKCLVDESLVSEISISRPFPCLEVVDPIPSMLRKLFGLTNGLSPSEAASVYLR